MHQTTSAPASSTSREVARPGAEPRSRILFVDDEPSILEALKRMLRSNRDCWDMEFVGSAVEALKALEREAFDVVVSDMRMPDMDGAQLLKEVQVRSPRTVRLVLSGYADLEASMRSVCVSHQYIAKPCDSEDLKRVVARACALEALLHDPGLLEMVGKVGELPVIPETYRALVDALAEAEVDLGRVGSIVERDQGIAAKILQLVNSSYFGVRREITSITQATTYLGVKTVRDLVLSTEVFREFESAARVAGFSLQQEQRHSSITARIARRLIDDRRLAEQAFLAAMLHDIGKLVMVTRVPDSSRKVHEAGGGTASPLHEVEEAQLGVSHAAIGAYLLGLWGMPYPIVEAIAHHHRPRAVQGQATFGVLGAVHVANCLAHEAEDPGSARLHPLDVDYLTALSVVDRLPRWREIAAEETERES